MPFRRNYGRGKRPAGWSRRKIPFRRLPRNVAKKRRHWVTLYNEPGLCEVDCLGTTEGCVQAYRLELVPNALLQTQFGDNVTVKRFVGEAYLLPFYKSPDMCSNDEVGQWFAWRNAMHNLRAGMIKQRVSIDNYPLGVAYDPMDSFDWSEAPWLREWRHTWLPDAVVIGQTRAPTGTLIGVSSDTTRAQYNTPATSSGSQPLFSVPAIETESCIPCEALSEECFYLGNYREKKALQYWRMPLNMRKTITMKESDRLDIFFSVAAPTLTDNCGDTPGGPPCFNQLPGNPMCNLQIQVGLKMLIEYG